MSQPPPNRYPPNSKGVPPLPPFPQLLHLKDSPPVQRSRSVSGTEPADDESTHQAMSPEEEDNDETPGQKEVKKEKKPHATRRRVVQSCSECRRR